MLEEIRARLIYAKLTAIIAVAACIASAALFASAAVAAPVYEGHIKGVPEAGFDLRFARANGKLFLNAIQPTDVPVSCEDGAQTLSSATQFSPDSETRVRDRAFDFAQDSKNGDFVRVAGQLKRGGKAAGIYKERATLGPPRGVCKTGRLEWVAHKV